MTPATALRTAINPALKLLPKAMDSREARVQLIATSLQESKLEHRWQVVNPKHPERKGPARGFLQFELGSKAKGGGVWGVFTHPASRYWLSVLCTARCVDFNPRAIWLAIEQDDVLAFGLGRLLLFTYPRRLPEVGDEQGGFDLYALRTWRPGAWTRGTPAQRTALRTKWADNYASACKAVPP